MGRSVSGLTSSSSEGSRIIIMNSKTILLFFGVLVCVAVSAVMAENEDGLAENSAVERIVRMADPARKERRKGKKAKSKKAKRTSKKKAKKAGKKKARRNKERKGKKVRKNQKQARQDSSTMVDSSCLMNAVQYMKVLKDLVGNFEKQNKRMKAQNKTGGNKAGKKGAFASIALNLVDIGGGNKSSLSCAGSTTNSGAKFP